MTIFKFFTSLLKFKPIVAPSVAKDGEIYYDKEADKFKAMEGGVLKNLISTGGSGGGGSGGGSGAGVSMAGVSGNYTLDVTKNVLFVNTGSTITLPASASAVGFKIIPSNDTVMFSLTAEEDNVLMVVNYTSITGGVSAPESALSLDLKNTPISINVNSRNPIFEVYECKQALIEAGEAYASSFTKVFVVKATSQDFDLIVTA